MSTASARAALLLLVLLIAASPSVSAAPFGGNAVDIRLEPDTALVSVGQVVSVDLVLSAGDPQGVSAVDAILAWDPARLELLGATLVDFPPFVAGFLNDPDGINDDLSDGEALYTALAPPGSPVGVPPERVVATFSFEVLTSGCVHLVPASGDFGATRVIGSAPGQDVTGTIGGPSLLEVPGTWVALGGALAGTGGLLPQLAADGALLPCDPWTLTVTDALPNTTAFVVLGFADLSAPLKGGVLVPTPDLIRTVPVGPTGTRVLSGAWPPDLPGGFDLYLQFWMVDPGGPVGFSASNAVRGTTP